MPDNVGASEHSDEPKPLLTRRAILKVITGAPLVVSFGLFASPLMRFLKPTMKPGNFFQSADLPTAEKSPVFVLQDLPEVWNCIPFMLPMKYLVFNSEQDEIRKIPCIVIRTGENDVVAFSRICPHERDHILNFIRPTADGSCGCSDKSCAGYCIGYAKTPSLVCPHDKSVFDVAIDGRSPCGPAYYSARKLVVNRDGERISIERFEHFGIA